MTKQFITRQRAGKGFTYYFNGQQITNKGEPSYLKKLRVPPAWQDVKISKNQNTKILATGVDKAGQLQYIYHPKFRARSIFQS